MRRRSTLIIATTAIAAIAILLALAEATGIEPLRYGAFAVIPIAGLAVVASRKARERAERTASDDGVEHELDVAARATTFRDALVAAALLVAASALLPQVAGWFWLALLMMVMLVGYGARARRRATGRTGEDGE